MELAVGAVLEGKVSGITKFGAFVALEDGKSGLVHISQVANSYVSDVHEHLQMGQTVRVKVLSIGEDGKINLSIKQAAEQPRQTPPPGMVRRAETAPAAPDRTAPAAGASQDFEDRLKRFMQESDSRIADNPKYSERKQRNRRR